MGNSARCACNLFENIGSGKHLSAEEVHEKLVKSSSKVSLATIYRTLRLLVQMGPLHELELSEGGHRYELLSNDTPDHHHLICIRCVCNVNQNGCCSFIRCFHLNGF